LIWITNYISKRKQKQALAGSSVKIAGKDVLATWKVIVAAVAAPALYGAYALVYLIYLTKRRPQLSLSAKMTRACLAWAIQPVLHYLLMRLGDTGLDIYKSIKPLFLAIRNPEAGQILRSIREDLSKDITEFINEHAPELGFDGSNSGNNSNSSSSSNSNSNSANLSRNNSQSNVLDLAETINQQSHESFLAESMSTNTTDEMPESYLVSSRDESFLDYSSSSDSRYQVESIVLDDDFNEEVDTSISLTHI
jgi:hypothetical protein